MMEKITHASATAANLLTNLTPMKTIVPVDVCVCVLVAKLVA